MLSLQFQHQLQLYFILVVGGITKKKPEGVKTTSENNTTTTIYIHIYININMGVDQRNVMQQPKVKNKKKIPLFPPPHKNWL